jgi:hypothetical protein
MAKVFRRTDRITVKVDDLTIKLSPLSLDQKNEIQTEFIQGRTLASPRHLTNGTVLALRYALKDLQGVVDADDKPYELSFEGGMVTDQCIEDLMNLEISDKLVAICATLANGVPREFTGPNGKKLEGVEIVQTKRESEEKNA